MTAFSFLNSITPEFYRDASRSLRPPEASSIALRAIDACERAQASTSILDADIATIVEAASVSWIRVWETAIHLLYILAVEHNEAKEAIRRLLSSKKAELRFRAIVFLKFFMGNKPFAEELILTGLKDKSPKVRAKGANMAGWHQLSTTLNALQESLRIEKNASAKHSISFTISMLRDGYLLVPEDEKRTILYLNLRREGYYWRSIAVNESDIARRGIQSIIDEERTSAR